MEPLVSVTCLTYNHANYVKNALDGMLMQNTNFPFEIIVHDDASTDGTQDILREYERAYPDIFNITYQKENQYSKTRSFVNIEMNFIMPKIRGKYIASCEGDDYWINPDKLQLQADYMESHPKCVLCFHPVVSCDESDNGRVFKIDQYSMVEKDYDSNAIISTEFTSVPTCSRMSRTDIAKEWPKFRRIADIGDLPAMFLFASRGYFHYLPNVMGVYRWNHPESWNAKHYNDTELIIKNALCTLNWLYEFNLYSERKFEVAVGHTMMSYIAIRLDILNAVGNYPWLVDIVIEAHRRKDKMLELEKIAKKTKTQLATAKYKDAQNEYWAWFVNAVGERMENVG